MKRRKKNPRPLCVIWNARDQRRFIDAVEKFAGLVGDMTILLEAAKRRKKRYVAPMPDPTAEYIAACNKREIDMGVSP